MCERVEKGGPEDVFTFLPPPPSHFLLSLYPYPSPLSLGTSDLLRGPCLPATVRMGAGGGGSEDGMDARRGRFHGFSKLLNPHNSLHSTNLQYTLQSMMHEEKELRQLEVCRKSTVLPKRISSLSLLPNMHTCLRRVRSAVGTQAKKGLRLETPSLALFHAYPLSTLAFWARVSRNRPFPAMTRIRRRKWAV